MSDPSLPTHPPESPRSEAETSDAAEPRRNSRGVLLVAGLLWLILLAVGWSSWQRLRATAKADHLCAAVESGDWRSVLVEGPRAVEELGATAAGLRASECLALAHFGAGDPASGLEILETARSAALREGEAWLPRPLLVLTLIEQRRRRGESAVDLARAGSAAYPEHELLAVTELDLRLGSEEPEEVLEAFRRRLPSFGHPATLLRARLGLVHGQRQEFALAAEVLGPEPPSAVPPEAKREWYRSSMAVAGLAQNADGIAEVARRWRTAGGSEAEILAWQALTVRIYGLRDPRFPMLAMLGAAADRRHELEDPALARNLMTRLVGTLLSLERYDEAAERLAQASADAIELPYTPEDVRRAARGHRLVEAEGDASVSAEGLLRFVVSGPGSRAGDGEGALRLLLSPGPEAAVDSDYESLPLASGVATAKRRLGSVPQRYVLRSDRRVYASGSVWPSAGEAVEVVLDLDTGRSVVDNPALDPIGVTADAARAAGRAHVGGRQRVLVLLLDGGDWRLVQYLRARGELPHLDRLIREGRRAVLWSEPAFTAAAMAAIASPTAVPDPGVFSALHRLGSEIGSNPFLGVNPVAALEWLVPERPSLFAAVGATDRVALNLLFAEGEVRAGKHGERVGPGGRSSSFTDWRSFRPPTPADRDWFPSLHGPGVSDARSETWDTWLESSFAAFDAFDRAVDDPEIDLVITRVAAFDSATHNGYAQVARGGPDDGRHPLFDLYRYADHRVGQVASRLDLDPISGRDILIVMSDHGIETAMEHDPRTFFVAVGVGVPPGRVPGRPHLRGVPKLFAELLGIETDWPETGLGQWGEGR